MSAFIISNETMQRVVGVISQESPFGDAWGGMATRHTTALDKIGTALFALNTEAVNCRYRETEEAPAYRYRPIGPVSDPDAYMALACLIYQCSEGKVPETMLYGALDKLKDRIADRIAIGVANARNVPWDWPERSNAA